MNPRDVLLGPQAAWGLIPVCDHYSGVPARMRKSLALQAQINQEFGACVLDVTLDCEDGAPEGAYQEHAQQVAELICEAPVTDIPARIAVRVHHLAHPAFASDVDFIVGHAASRARLSHVMLPKVESLAEVSAAVQALDQAGAPDLPLHVLIESPAAVERVFEIAGHPRVQSLSFGLMDFVSAHAGAIPAHALTAQGQFEHPLVVRAKLRIAAACHAHAKVPSHCVVTEYAQADVTEHAARQAAQTLGYTRMWSIHPEQIRPILRAFTPPPGEVADAAHIVQAAALANWAPIAVQGRLHDKASYRYYWGVLERAHRTGQELPVEIQAYF